MRSYGWTAFPSELGPGFQSNLDSLGVTWLLESRTAPLTMVLPWFHKSRPFLVYEQLWGIRPCYPNLRTPFSMSIAFSPLSDVPPQPQKSSTFSIGFLSHVFKFISLLENDSLQKDNRFRILALCDLKLVHPTFRPQEVQSLKNMVRFTASPETSYPAPNAYLSLQGKGCNKLHQDLYYAGQHGKKISQNWGGSWNWKN